MRRHALRGFATGGAESGDLTLQARFRERLALRIEAPRDDILPEIDGDPARLEEHALAIIDDVAALAEQLHLVAQRVGQLHRPAMVPERSVVPLRCAIMEDQ